MDIIKLASLENGILQISLNRPESLNALSQEMLKRLSDILENARLDSAVKTILLSGEGKGFCAGADIKQLATLNGQSGLAFASFGQQVFNQLESLGKPSLAVLHGFALG